MNFHYIEINMKKIYILFLLIISAHQYVFSQERELDRIADSIKREGELLHHSDWASWYGTDVFLARLPGRRSLSGGFLSYDNGKGWTNIFFTKGDVPKVIATIAFAGYNYNKDNYTLDTAERALTPIEKDMFTIRRAAIKRSETDTLFKFYRNTDYNPIPIMINGQKRVYIVTGTSENNVVIFGNDYLFTFNQDNSIAGVRRLHKNIIKIITKDTSATIQTGGMHTHLPETGDFITATDICTLMGYEQFTNWQTYYVLSKNYVSIWDCKKNMLVILTMDAWKKIATDSH